MSSTIWCSSFRVRPTKQYVLNSLCTRAIQWLNAARSSGHPVIQRTALVQNAFWWPLLALDDETQVKAYHVPAAPHWTFRTPHKTSTTLVISPLRSPLTSQFQWIYHYLSGCHLITLKSLQLYFTKSSTCTISQMTLCQIEVPNLPFESGGPFVNN